MLLACNQDTGTVLKAITSDPRGTPQRNPVLVARWKLTSAKNNPTLRAVMWDLVLFPRPMLGDIPGSVCTKYASQSVTVITVLPLSLTWAPQGSCAGGQQNPQLVRQQCSITLGISGY